MMFFSARWIAVFGALERERRESAMREGDEGAVEVTEKGEGGDRPFVRFNRRSLIDRLRESEWDSSIIMRIENQ